jgi:hypothetical protein
MQRRWTEVKRISIAISIALCGAGVWFYSADVQGACQEGKTARCTRNGCEGLRVCVGGRMLGCEVPDTCVVPPLPTTDSIVIDQVVPGQEVGLLYDGADTAGTFNDRGALVTASAGTVATRILQNVQGPAFGNWLVTFSRSRQPRANCRELSTCCDQRSCSRRFWIRTGVARNDGASCEGP